MSSETAVETKYCSNCKKDIAAANFTMHEVHCRRHLVLCELCQEPVPRTEKEQHFNDVHAKVPCSQCAVELEKDQLEAHLENDCPKRQVCCEYCELEVPHCDLASHLEFCSTRTEACPRCGNFIMHKDLLRHNSSNCTYPEVKPPASQTGGSRDRGGGGERFRDDHLGGIFGRRQLDDSMDPFQFDEIRRLLEGDADGRGLPSLLAGDSDNLQSLLAEDSDASAAAGESGRNRRERRQGFRKTPPLRVPEQKKNDTRGGGQKVATNRRSDVNRRRDQAIPPEIDYDTMLAVQLAAVDDEGAGDIDPDAHLNQLISSYEKRSSRSQGQQPPLMEVDNAAMPASPPPGYDEFAAADEDMIPCEFCGENFPAFALVHHQSVCDPLASGLWGPGQDGPPAAFGRNNEMFNQWKPAASRPPTIPVINNLGSASPAQDHEEETGHHLSDNGDHLLPYDSLEMTMLPCEFCNELLPADSLVQHQAMCEGKPATPAAAQPSSGLSVHNQRHHFFPTSSSGSQNQQHDPTGELLANISRGGQGNGPANPRPKKKPNASRGGNAWRPSETFISVSRPGHQFQQRGLEADDEQDISLHSRRGSRQNQGRQDSASRTRHTLDSLLSEEGRENQGPAGTGSRDGGGGGGQNRRAQGSRRRTPNTGSGTNSSSFATGVSSRTVMRNMQQQDRRQRPRGDSATEGDGVAGGRRPQRERGDHVFNSSGNSRNPPNPNRQRRSSDRHMPEWN